jgi:hypothetical protein
MDQLFDRLSRDLARTPSRRAALRAFLAAIAAAGLAACGALSGSSPSKTCPDTAPIDCNGDGNFCCKTSYSCCFKAEVCCLGTFPHYCPNTKLCYKFAPEDVCGLSYEVCGVPTRPLPPTARADR